MQKTHLQKIKKVQDKPTLVWVGKKPLERIEYYPAQEIEKEIK